MLVFAAEALREIGIPVGKKYVLQLNSDEEVGSPSSRVYTEAEARRSDAVLVAEPAAGLGGNLKTGRKGGGTLRLRVRGRAAHAGLDFASGASAIVELSRQLSRIAEWTNLKTGITVNPGVIHGGSRANVVAEEAWADIDVRVPRATQGRRLEQRFRALKPFDPRTELEQLLEGGIGRPPLERSGSGLKLYRLAQKLSSELGFEVGEAPSGRRVGRQLHRRSGGADTGRSGIGRLRRRRRPLSCWALRLSGRRVGRKPPRH